MANKDNTPESLYQQMKERAAPPSSVRRRVLDAHRRSVQPRPFARQWLVALAGGCAFTALLFVSLSSTVLKQEQEPLTAYEVELHGFAAPATVQENYQVAKTRSYNDYQQQRYIVSERHAIRAAVLDNGDELVLVSCDNTKMVLSSELTALLREENQLPTTLRKGDIVELALNQSGFVLGATPATTGQMCI